MFKKIIIIFILLTFSLTLYFLKNNAKNDLAYLVINDKKIKIEIAETPSSHYQGLSDRKNLCEGCGMLFIFKDKKVREFIMRRMHFSLDIIWIEDDKIINISKNLKPEGANPKETYSSEREVNYVLEVNGGFCNKNNIKIGDKINL